MTTAAALPASSHVPLRVRRTTTRPSRLSDSSTSSPFGTKSTTSSPEGTTCTPSRWSSRVRSSVGAHGEPVATDTRGGATSNNTGTSHPTIHHLSSSAARKRCRLRHPRAPWAGAVPRFHRLPGSFLRRRAGSERRRPLGRASSGRRARRGWKPSATEHWLRALQATARPSFLLLGPSPQRVQYVSP